MKSAASSWSQLPAQEKAAIQEECSDYDKQRSAEVDPAKVIKEKLESLHKITGELEALGAHCITIVMPSSSVRGTAVHVTTTASMRSAKFLTDPDNNTVDSFVKHVQDLGSTAVQLGSASRKELERTCRTLLNKAYGGFVGTNSKPFPYKALKPCGDLPPSLIVHGATINPNGLSGMGVTALAKIVDNIDSIRFERRTSNPSPSEQPVSTRSHDFEHTSDKVSYTHATNPSTSANDQTVDSDIVKLSDVDTEAEPDNR